MSTALVFALVCAIVLLAYGGWSISWIMAKPAGNERMREIAAAIQAGAQAYLNRQYATIGIVGVVLFVLIWWAIGERTAGGFAIGALLSGLAGYIGMNVSVRSNVRTADAARTGLNEALAVAFRRSLERDPLGHHALAALAGDDRAQRHDARSFRQAEEIGANGR